MSTEPASNEPHSNDPRLSNEPQWSDDLAALDRRLREELREEAREVEALVEESDLRAQTLEDVVLELINRGDTVQIGTPRRVFMGQLVYAGKDFVTIEDPESFVDVSVAQPCFVKFVEKSKSGGGARGEGPATFEMRLMEHKMEFAEVEIHSTAMAEPLQGRITVIGQDHVVLVDRYKEQWIFPLSSVTFVIRRNRVR